MGRLEELRDPDLPSAGSPRTAGAAWRRTACRSGADHGLRNTRGARRRGSRTAISGAGVPSRALPQARGGSAARGRSPANQQACVRSAARCPAARSNSTRSEPRARRSSRASQVARATTSARHEVVAHDRSRARLPAPSSRPPSSSSRIQAENRRQGAATAQPAGRADAGAIGVAAASPPRAVQAGGIQEGWRQSRSGQQPRGQWRAVSAAMSWGALVCSRIRQRAIDGEAVARDAAGRAGSASSSLRAEPRIVPGSRGRLPRLGSCAEASRYLGRQQRRRSGSSRPAARRINAGYLTARSAGVAMSKLSHRDVLTGPAQVQPCRPALLRRATLARPGVVEGACPCPPTTRGCAAFFVGTVRSSDRERLRRQRPIAEPAKASGRPGSNSPPFGPGAAPPR